MSKNFIFSSESVGEGHPDKVCDTISDAVLDACLAQDPTSRVACETYAKCNLVVVGGEITTKADLSEKVVDKIVRETIREIGYVDPNMRIWLDSNEMRKREISVDDVIAAIQQGTLLTPSGFMDNGPKETNVRILSETGTPAEFANLVIPARAGYICSPRLCVN